MIKLSDRLELIASKINKGDSVADIGTDHGLLPISLLERGIAAKVIMADISKGSLDKAIENCQILSKDKSFDFRLGDGLAVINNGEVDDIVIAGMGGLLMIKIFESDIEKTKSFNKYVLQPRISSGRLRYWLLHNGFSITDDNLVEEGKYICNVITAVTKENVNLTIIQNGLSDILSIQEDDIRLDVPKWLKGEKLFSQFVKRRLEQEKGILSSMEHAGESWNNKKRITVNNIKYLEGFNYDETI